MPITSQLHWDVYKEKVEGSQDKSLELFATKVEVPRTLLDLNRNVSSPIHDGVVVYDHIACSQPLSSQPNEEDINARAIVLLGDDHVGDEAVAHVDEHANVHVDEDAIAHVDGDAIAQDDVYAEEEEIHYNPIGDLDVIVHQQDVHRKSWMMRVHRKSWMRMDSRRKKVTFTRRSMARKEDPLRFVILVLPTRPLLMVA